MIPAPLPDIVIQPMNEVTVERVAWIEAACFPDPWSPQALRDELQNPRARYFTAILGKAALGYAGLHQIVDEGHITNVAVDPSYRRQGVGHRLIAAVLDYCRENRFCLVTLEARASNHAAIRLYEAHGFVPLGLRPGYYTHPKEDALIMTKYLRDEDEQ